MKVTMEEHACIVEREEGDPKFYGDVEARGESRLLYHVQQILNDQGYDLIKKRMWKDGHMVSDMQQYLRTRKKGAGKADVYIYNPFWQIRGANDDFNRGQVKLQVVRDVFEDGGEK